MVLDAETKVRAILISDITQLHCWFSIAHSLSVLSARFESSLHKAEHTIIRGFEMVEKLKHFCFIF